MWDLTEVSPGRMNISAIASLLALADRLRDYTKTAPRVRIFWNPSVLAFWDDIAFISLSQQEDIFSWPTDQLGGYSRGKTNPASRLILCRGPSAAPDYSESQLLEAWKDTSRAYWRSDLGALLDPRGFIDQAEPSQIRWLNQLRANLATALSELVTNALAHGRAPAFVALQRSSRARISTAVCDAGIGFRQSMIAQMRLLQIAPPPDDLTAILLAHFVNSPHAEGVRRVTDIVMEHDGWVEVTSGKGSVHWRPDLWHRFRTAFDGLDLYNASHRHLAREIDSIHTTRPDRDARDRGYFREWAHPLRGARVSFELPASN